MKILSACLELTELCRVGCPYCLLEEKSPEGAFEDWRRIVGALSAHGVMRYTLGGAEPLEVPYLYEVAAEIQRVGGIALLRTSACRPIDVSKAAELFEVVDVSVDSHRPEVLKICKPNADSAVVFRNIEQLLAKGATVRCNILLTQCNYDHIGEFVMYLGSLGVPVVRLQKLVRRGLAKKSYPRFELTEAEFADAVSRAQDAAVSCGISSSVLTSVSEETLCIVKPHGGLFRGNPDGIVAVGSVFENGALDRAAAYLGESQMRHYGCELGLV